MESDAGATRKVVLESIMKSVTYARFTGRLCGPIVLQSLYYTTTRRLTTVAYTLFQILLFKLATELS